MSAMESDCTRPISDATPNAATATPMFATASVLRPLVVLVCMRGLLHDELAHHAVVQQPAVLVTADLVFASFELHAELGDIARDRHDVRVGPDHLKAVLHVGTRDAEDHG